MCVRVVCLGFVKTSTCAQVRVSLFPRLPAALLERGASVACVSASPSTPTRQPSSAFPGYSCVFLHMDFRIDLSREKKVSIFVGILLNARTDLQRI